MDIFHVFLFIPIFNFIIFLYRLFGNDLGLALIAVAIISRALTIPLTNRQIKSAEKNSVFQQKYNAIKKKYKKNKEKMSEELAKLQAKYLPGQLGGCLPIIIQLLVFIQIYNVLRNIFENGVETFNEVAYPFLEKFTDGASINSNFLGGIIDLGQTPASVGTDNLLAFIPYLLLVIGVVVTQYFSAKILTGARAQKKKEKQKESSKKKKGEGESDFSDIMQMTGKQMLFVMPLMIGFVSFSAPAGLSLYWTVQSAFVIIQRLITKRKELSSKKEIKTDINQSKKNNGNKRKDKKKN